ncbi:MAG: hypothetical protein CVU01_01260 [Bacteroidetes bacterium HGW-Bacteroidetes-18]|nr:MAG: hypothetical protein CVU01_01260 [Bacteroidetes bacterium HGW-Bacteroidetes-18]
MPMPGRQIVGGELYRYAFQGQEKDPETGKEAFQLRLWDSRIGRWLTTDPAGQYSSPYLGMGNDPINGIDPDGAWSTRAGRFLAWMGNGFKGTFSNTPGASDPNNNFGIRMTYTPDEGGAGISISHSNDALNRNTMLYDMSKFSNPEISNYSQSNILSITNLASGMTIGIVDQASKDLVRNGIMVNSKLNTYNLYRSNGTLNGNQYISGSKYLNRVGTIKTVARYASVLNYLSLGEGYVQSYRSGDQRNLVKGTTSFIITKIPYYGAVLSHKIDNSNLKYYHLSHYIPSLYNDPFNENSLIEGMLNK